MNNDDISGITMETDWGARGSRLTGRQVQLFIKAMFNRFIDHLAAHDQDITDINGRIDSDEQSIDTHSTQIGQINSTVAGHTSSINSINSNFNALTGGDLTLLNKLKALAQWDLQGEIASTNGRVSTLETDLAQTMTNLGNYPNFWKGTEEEYEALTEIDENTIYMVKI